ERKAQGAPHAAGGAGDNDGLALQFHRSTPEEKSELLLSSYHPDTARNSAPPSFAVAILGIVGGDCPIRLWRRFFRRRRWRRAAPSAAVTGRSDWPVIATPSRMSGSSIHPSDAAPQHFLQRALTS